MGNVSLFIEVHPFFVLPLSRCSFLLAPPEQLNQMSMGKVGPNNVFAPTRKVEFHFPQRTTNREKKDVTINAELKG
jgi:hypothetical protein